MLHDCDEQYVENDKDNGSIQTIGAVKSRITIEGIWKIEDDKIKGNLSRSLYGLMLHRMKWLIPCVQKWNENFEMLHGIKLKQQSIQNRYYKMGTNVKFQESRVNKDDEDKQFTRLKNPS